MSCLTKKSLFFIVLFIVCNQTYSDRSAVCEAHLRLVFPPGMETFLGYKDSSLLAFNIETKVAFDFSMFALSFNVIDAMTTTRALSTSLLDQFEKFKHNFKEDDIRFLIVISEYVGSQNEDTTFSDAAKTDISGYFKRLITHFNTIYNDIVNGIKSPITFCKEKYKYDGEACITALKDMLQKKTDEELNKMDADDAFRHCYLNYRYLNFFDDSIYSASSSSDTDIPLEQKLIQNFQIRIMSHYFKHLMKKIIAIAMKKFKTDHNLFPNVEYYCGTHR